jgi:predicted aspartyl protease
MGMGFRSGLLLALLLTSGCADQLVLDDDGALLVVPHKVGSQGHIIVQAMINDHGPYRFALDTGASISVVFDETREKTGLELLAGEQVLVHGMIGSGHFPLTTVTELKVGMESWGNARLASLPGNSLVPTEIDGILGVDFLSRYAVGVSARDRVVRMYSPALVSNRSYRGWHSIPMRKLQVGQGTAFAYSINLQINKITIPAILDLGAGFNLMNWRAARAIEVKPKGAMSRKIIYGAVEDARIVAELDIKKLRVENLHWRHRLFYISKFSIFEVLDLENQPAAIVGPAFFKDRDFVIDFVRNRLLIRAGD